MDEIETGLETLGLELPPAKSPVANYLGCKQSGNLLFVSGRVSRLRGEVGTDVTLDEAKEAAQSTMLDLLAIVKAAIGNLDRIVSVEKLNGFVRSSSEFSQQPLVIDGASDLLIELWGQNGRHARTATGVAQLPFGACVQIEMIMRLGSQSK